MTVKQPGIGQGSIGNFKIIYKKSVGKQNQRNSLKCLEV